MQYENNKALIRADIEDKKIFIFVIGNQETRRVFLAIIRHDFEHIHKTIAKIEVKEKIIYKNVVLDYQRLLKLESRCIKEDFVEDLNEMVDIANLLNSVKSKHDICENFGIVNCR